MDLKYSSFEKEMSKLSIFSCHIFLYRTHHMHAERRVTIKSNIRNHSWSKTWCKKQHNCFCNWTTTQIIYNRFHSKILIISTNKVSIQFKIFVIFLSFGILWIKEIFESFAISKLMRRVSALSSQFFMSSQRCSQLLTVLTIVAWSQQAVSSGVWLIECFKSRVSHNKFF